MKISLTPLDKLFSLYIRTRAKGICERCGQYKGIKGLQCSHFWGRAKKSTRWDEENCAALCFGCHQYFTSHPAEHTEWFKKRLGEVQYDLLMARAHIPGKPDIEGLTLYFKEKLKELA